MKKAILIMRLVIAGIVLIIVAIGLVGGGYINLTKEKSKMDLETTSVLETTIPPIDAAAPVETETATFALG
jgi:uncharacterized membrane protein YidH (DUF202 family)